MIDARTEDGKGVVVLGKEYYYVHEKVLTWCVVHLGPGAWSYVLESNLDWAFSTMFGNTKILFRNPQDMSMLLLALGSFDANN